MRIAELARRTGLPAHTIRFYEQQGLLDARHTHRDVNNYRAYTEAAVERLRLIGHSQGIGFTLAEIRALFQAWDDGVLTPDAQREHLEGKLAEVEAKLHDLARMRDYLRTKLATLAQAAPTSPHRVAG